MTRSDTLLLPGPARRTVRPVAFTLIELLVVVAIISILASIATPNFLEAQTRAKVSRVLNDARVIATALETYMIDNNKYPPRTQARAFGGLLWNMNIGRCDTKMKELSVLTTPVGYISSVPIDVFDKQMPRPNNVLDYWSPEITDGIVERYVADTQGYNPKTDPQPRGPGYVVLSVGPDNALGYSGNLQGCPSVSVNDVTRYTAWTQYDPTNGTVSLGNVFRVQAGGEACQYFHDLPGPRADNTIPTSVFR